MEEDLFRVMFEAQAKSPTLRAVWSDAYGVDYPDQADPLSFVTNSDLDRLGSALGLNPGDDLVDVGCGAGGAGAHVARSAGARLTGVDFSGGALVIARQRHLGRLPDGSRFQQGESGSTGWPYPLSPALFVLGLVVWLVIASLLFFFLVLNRPSL